MLQEQKIKEKRYISLAVASSLCQYSQEYLSLRARQGKLKAVKRARKWVTTKEWLQEYVEKHEAFVKGQSSIRYISLKQASDLCQYSQEYLSLRARQRRLKALKKDRNWVTTKKWLAEYLEKISLKKEKDKEKDKEPSYAGPAISSPSILPKIDFAKQPYEIKTAAGLPRLPVFKSILAMAKKCAGYLIGVRSKLRLVLTLAKKGKRFLGGVHYKPNKPTKSGWKISIFEGINLFQREFADVARLVVIFLLIGSAIFFVVKPGVEIAKERGMYVWHGGREAVMRGVVTPLRPAKLALLASFQKMPQLIWKESREIGSISRLAVIKALDLGHGVAMKFERESVNKTIISLQMSLQNSVKDIIATYKIGSKIIASAYKNAPENIAIKWVKVEQNNESIKIALRGNAQTSVATAGRVWQSVQHITFDDIAYGAKNLMARAGKKTFVILIKADAGYQELESKYSNEKTRIKEFIVSARLAYNYRKEQTKTAFNFIKSHPEVIFEKTGSSFVRAKRGLLANFEYLEGSGIKGIWHFAANYKVGLRVISNSYKTSPQNIAMGWQKLEKRNEGVKIGLRGGIVSKGLALKKGAQTVFTEGSRNLVKSATKPVFLIARRTSSGSQNIYFRTQKILSGLTEQARSSAIKIADLGGQASFGVQSGLSRISFGIQEIWVISSKGALKGFNITWKIAVVPLQLSFEQSKLQNEISFSAIKSFYKYSPKILSVLGNKTTQFSGNAANVLKSSSAAAFERSLDVAGRGAEKIYAGIKSAGRAIARGLSRSYEFAIEIFRSSQKPEEIAVKEPQQQIKETASEQKQGMVVVPSTDKDEETKKKIRDSFSDEVKVEIQDDSSGILTPVFRDKEGDRYLYMMVPISEPN